MFLLLGDIVTYLKPSLRVLRIVDVGADSCSHVRCILDFNSADSSLNDC
jgi:hypothetical protein